MCSLADVTVIYWFPVLLWQEPPVPRVWNGEGGEQGGEAALSLPLPGAARLQPGVRSLQLQQHPPNQLLRLRQRQHHSGGQAQLQ